MGNLWCVPFRGGTAADLDAAEAVHVGQRPTQSLRSQSIPQTTGTRGNQDRTRATNYSGVEKSKTWAASSRSVPRPNSSRNVTRKTGTLQSNEGTATHRYTAHSSVHDSQLQTTQCPSEPQMGVAGNPTVISRIGRHVNLIEGSSCIVASKASGCVSIYKPPMKCLIEEGTGLKSYVVGAANEDECTPPPSYVILLVGATGAGKSTLVNGIANYVLGVRYEDLFRYKLITDEGTIGQAHSQTQQVSTYTFCRRASSPVQFAVTVIDTPGFGDTGGLDRDKRILVELKHFLSTTCYNSVHAVGFVTQATLPRLTPTQTYICNSILRLFGKDIASNILLMTTFADSNKPPILEPLREAGVPFRKYFKFNNSALYPDDQPTDSQEPDDTGPSINHMFWNLCMKGFRGLFGELHNMEARSLLQTKSVRKEQDQLALITHGLQQRGLMVVARIAELKEEERVLIKHKANIEDNRQFKYMINVAWSVKEDNKGIEATNCQQCQCTCHEKCDCPMAPKKCVAMQNDICTVCRCNLALHTRETVKFVRRIVEERRSYEDLKRKYAQAMYEVRLEVMVAECRKQITAQYHEALLLVHRAQQNMASLSAPALKPKSTSGAECIDSLIHYEEDCQESGYQDRVKRLQLIQGEAEKLSLYEEAEYQYIVQKTAEKLAKIA